MSEHLNGSGCPNCKKSKGEKKIRLFYESQKTFDDCKGVRNKLPFDFYLNELNILIEYDGRQHFQPVEHRGGENEFLRNKECDKIKNEFALKNEIKLIRIPYHIKDINKELRKLLFQEGSVIEVGGVIFVSGQIVYNPQTPQPNLFAVANPAGQIMFSVNPSGNAYVSGNLYVAGTTTTN